MLQNSLLLGKKNFVSPYIKKTFGEGTSDEDAYMIDLHCQTFAIPNTFSFKVIEITADQIARPDLISMDLYDTDIYGDLLCKINGISDPFSLNEGTRLVVPAESSIMEFFTNDPFFDNNDIDGNEQKPVAKKRKEKRKANDAVVGDTRFKIDSQRRVVIY